MRNVQEQPLIGLGSIIVYTGASSSASLVLLGRTAVLKCIFKFFLFFFLHEYGKPRFGWECLGLA